MLFEFRSAKSADLNSVGQIMPLLFRKGELFSTPSSLYTHTKSWTSAVQAGPVVAVAAHTPLSFECVDRRFPLSVLALISFPFSSYMAMLVCHAFACRLELQLHKRL